MAQTRYVAKGHAPSVEATARRVGFNHTQAATVADIAAKTIGTIAAEKSAVRQTISRVKTNDTRASIIATTKWQKSAELSHACVGRRWYDLDVYLTGPRGLSSRPGAKNVWAWCVVYLCPPDATERSTLVSHGRMRDDSRDSLLAAKERAVACMERDYRRREKKKLATAKKGTER